MITTGRLGYKLAAIIDITDRYAGNKMGVGCR